MELPRLQPLYDTYREQGFEIVAVEAKRDTERATKFIYQHKLSFTCLENGEGNGDVVRGQFGVRGFPTSFLVDRQGRVMYYHLGFEEGDEAEIEEQLKTLL